MRDQPYQYIVTQRVDNPAAGTDFQYVCPGDRICRISSIAFVLTTSAVAATRTVRLQASDGTSTWFISPCTSTQAASLAYTYSGWSGSPEHIGTGISEVIPFPTDGLVLLPGHMLISSIVNLSAGDQISDIAMQVYAYPTGAGHRITPDVPVFTENYWGAQNVT